MDVEIVITGIGVVSPLGTGLDAFAAALDAGRSGVAQLARPGAGALAVPFGGEVRDFEPKQYVRPRKSLKVMSREIRFACGAAQMACDDAGLAEAPVAPERLGVVFGADMLYTALEDVAPAYAGCIVDGRFDFKRWGQVALDEMHPLWMLKYLPNMPSCHIGIAHDARGPSNSITLGEVSSLLAISEGMRVIERGAADAMIVGGAGSRLDVTPLIFRGNRRLSHRTDDPAAAARPFDAARDGLVNGEGAAALILERRQTAEARGARMRARLLGYGCGFDPLRNGAPADAIEHSLRQALAASRLAADQIGHVNAHGIGTIDDDRREAQAIRAVLGDVPVTAPKSYFGHLGAGSGAVELLVSVLALERGLVPPTLNYETPDPDCPVEVVRGAPWRPTHPTALVLNQAAMGQAVAVALAAM